MVIPQIVVVKAPSKMLAFQRILNVLNVRLSDTPIDKDPVNVTTAAVYISNASYPKVDASDVNVPPVAVIVCLI
jgi:hypothetical protein